MGIGIEGSIIKWRNSQETKQVQNDSYSTKFRFLATDSLLNQIKSLVAENQEDVIVITQNLLKLETLQSTFAGSILDLLYYQLFQTSQMIIQVEQVIDGHNYKKFFSIAVTMPFNVPEQKKSQSYEFEKMLGSIISSAINNPDKMILGFQTSFVKKSNYYPKGYKISTVNPLFDFVIISFSNDQLKIESFDSTIEQVHTKIGKFKKKKSYQILKKQIERINKSFKKKVLWKYHLLTFENIIKVYQKTNHYENFQVMFMKCLDTPPKPQKSLYNTKKQTKPQKSQYNTKKQTEEVGEKEGNSQRQFIPFVALGQNIGKITLGISMIPNRFHLTFPYNKVRNQQLFLSQMRLLQAKVDQLKDHQINQKK